MKQVPYIIILFIISFLSCNITEPANSTLRMQLQGASCTEAWIKISGIPGSEVTLKKDDKELLKLTLAKEDTVVFEDSLTPNTKYTYQATGRGYIRNGNRSSISLTTLDTTSHNFTWQSFTFGENSSSVLYDVAIIDENNIWAVGEIYMNDSYTYDSLGNWIDPYNAIHWNGNEWELKRVYYNYNGQKLWNPLQTIYAFNENDIWFGPQIHWNGQLYEQPNISFLTGIITKMWGTSNNDLYAVGNNGNIAYYNGKRWQKIESGTDLDIYDIYGATDKLTNKQEILAVCTRNFPLGHAILSIEGNKAIEIPSDPIKYELFSLWFIPNVHYFVIGDGIFEKNNLNEAEWKNGPLDITRYATTRIRGNELNDIFVVGAFGEMLHNNGVSWKSYIGQTGLINGSYTSVAIKGNLVVAVGADSPHGIITIGRR